MTSSGPADSSALPAPSEEDIALAADLVRSAGLLAQRMRAEGVRSKQKSNVSDLVTEADRAAEDLITTRLRAERPADSVLGEEGAGYQGTSDRCWVIDPIDGTYNYAAGLDWWCCALALVHRDPASLTSSSVEEHTAILGAVYQPATDQLYLGGPGLPSTCDQTPIRSRDTPLPHSAVTTYLHPPFWGTAVAEAFHRAIGPAATWRVLGSGTMDAMAIASGQLGAQLQHSVPVWDRFPGEAIIAGAGGRSARVEAAGVTWYAAGSPRAVQEILAGLAEPQS